MSTTATQDATGDRDPGGGEPGLDEDDQHDEQAGHGQDGRGHEKGGDPGGAQRPEVIELDSSAAGQWLNLEPASTGRARTR